MQAVDFTPQAVDFTPQAVDFTPQAGNFTPQAGNFTPQAKDPSPLTAKTSLRAGGHRWKICGGIVVVMLIIVVVVLAFHKWHPNAPKKKGGTYTLDTDLSGGKVKPDNSNPDSMRFYVKDSDPTGGYVNYADWDDLVTVEAGKTKISAGESGAGGRRNMVRLVSKKMYNSGLFVISADHIPEGNGVWPSFWLTSHEPSGSKWACNGEIDIIEGVNSVGADSSHNASTLHTSDKPGVPPCRQVGVPGISKGGDPTAYGTKKDYTCGCDGKSICPYAGAGVTLGSPASFGWGFNNAGGGVYACELTPEGAITIWFFPAGQEPADLVANNPDPSKWPATNRTTFNPCPGQFANMQMVLNTTLCGQWAGDKYRGAGGSGTDACNAYIKNADLSKAYWSINYVKVFVRNDVYPGAVAPEPTPWRDSTGGTHNPGTGALACGASVAATAAGQDMYATGCCSNCGAGLIPYLIVPKGGTDGKYFCYADSAAAGVNGNKVIKQEAPVTACGGVGPGPAPPGPGPTACTPTPAGGDMFGTSTSSVKVCCACAEGLQSYLVSKDGKTNFGFRCYADAAAAAKGHVSAVLKNPPTCPPPRASGFRARNAVHQSMEDFMGGF